MTLTAPDLRSDSPLTLEAIQNQSEFWKRVRWSVRNGVVYHHVEDPQHMLGGQWIKTDKEMVKRLLDAGSQVMGRFIDAQLVKAYEEIERATPTSVNGGVDPAHGGPTSGLGHDDAGNAGTVPGERPAGERNENVGIGL